MKTISCNAAYSSGGLGKHLAEVVEEARKEGSLDCYFSTSPQLTDPKGHKIQQTIFPMITSYTPIRFLPSWKSYLSFETFDRSVSTKLKCGKVFVGFNGQALHSFRQAYRLGYSQLVLESPNSHVTNVMRQHKCAAKKCHFIEQDWLNYRLYSKILKEYETADLIYVNSEYSYQSFIQEGFSEEKLCRRVLCVSSQFQPPPNRINDGVFRVVYVGSLTQRKGISVLLEAFSRLSGKAELTLVGGSGSRGMRNYLETWLRKDTRIRIMPGDPIPHLHKANVYVHPSFEDGFAYSAMEALACKVIVIVTEDTGMKEYVQEGVNGYVVPTGDWKAILERLEYLRQLM